MKEQRRHMRFDVLLDAFLKRLGGRKRVKVNNFSRNGLGIITDEDIVQGDDLELELHIPGDNIPVVITGQLAWTEKKNDEASVSQAGVKIDKIEKKGRVKILNHIFDVISKQDND